jgi:hypothetical protein
VEAIREGDRVLSRDEHDASGPVSLRIVEEVFERYAHVLWVTVSGRRIGTTDEHPFHLSGQGWTAANELRVGDRVTCRDGSEAEVEKVEAGGWQLVYNMRIADFHTYFVGCDEWGFSVWAHNADCGVRVAEDGSTLEIFDHANPNAVLHRVTAQHEGVAFLEINDYLARNNHTLYGEAVQPLGPILREHPAFSDGLPYEWKETSFRKFVASAHEELARAGYPDAELFLQGSSVTGVKFKTGEVLDSGLGILPKDYDIGVVSPIMSERAAALRISDHMKGHLNPDNIALLGLSNAQLYLSTSSRRSIPVNFKLYPSFLGVYEGGHPTIPSTIPFAKFRSGG